MHVPDSELEEVRWEESRSRSGGRAHCFFLLHRVSGGHGVPVNVSYGDESDWIEGILRLGGRGLRWEGG